MRYISGLWLLLLLSGCAMVPEGDTKNQKASKINVQLGIGYYNQGNLEIANEKLLRALRQDPDSSQAHHAYAVLQNRFLDKEKAEKHFKKSVELDPENSEALNNYGTFLCKEGKIEVAEKMFLAAVANPLYHSPEVAFTNAAVCLLEHDQSKQETARKYLIRALGVGNNYRPALLEMADITFKESDYKLAALYLERYHLVGAESPRSLWLQIRNELELGHLSQANVLAEKLKHNFPDSAEYQAYLELQK